MYTTELKGRPGRQQSAYSGWRRASVRHGRTSIIEAQLSGDASFLANGTAPLPQNNVTKHGQLWLGLLKRTGRDLWAFRACGDDLIRCLW